MTRRSPQLIVFSYHKSGTSLFLHVMTKVSQKLGLSLANHYGFVTELEIHPDIVLLPHSLLRAPLDRPYRAIRLIRDPRDIWVSGYLYHLRCDEEWCRNTNTDPAPPIGWPQVDYSFAHWPEAWKRGFLERLNGKSYQQNLLDRSRADGLDFELGGYTGCTLATMRDWHLNGADALDVKLEDVMADFDRWMLRIFTHFGFSADQSQAALEVARSEDVRRMDESAIASRPQITSRTIAKWRGVLSPDQVLRFQERYGDLISDLGYQLEDGEAGAPQTTKVPRDTGRPGSSTIDPGAARSILKAGIQLSADGVAIRPSDIGIDTYSFVVPSHTRQVCLESYPEVAAQPDTDVVDNSAGMRVSRITICCHSRDDLILADDPRLATGWRDAERVGTSVSRCTSGSAELPWSDVTGPAVVTVYGSVLSTSTRSARP